MTPLGWIFAISTLAAMIAIWALSTALAVGRSGLARAAGWTLPVLLVGGSLLVTGALYAGTVMIQLDATLWQVSLAMLVVATIAGLTIAVAGMRGRAPARSWPMRRLVAATSLPTLMALGTLVLLDRARLAEIGERRAQNEAERATLVRSAADRDAYRKFPQLLTPNSGVRALMELQQLEWPMPPAGFERDRWISQLTPLLDGSGPLFAHLERTAQLVDADLGPDPRMATIASPRTYLQSLRSVARVASIDAQLAAARGDRVLAIARCMQIDQMADHVATTPSNLDQFVSYAIRSLATTTMSAIAADIDLDEPRLFADDFDRAASARVERALRLESAMAESLVLNVAEGGAYGQLAPGIRDIPPIARPIYRLLFLPTELRSLDRVRAAALEAASQLPAPPPSSAIETLEARPPGIFAPILVSGTGKVIDVARAVQATPSLRRALRLLQGTPPEAWDELKLPTDPLSPNGGSLRRVRDAKGGNAIIVYTVGANGVDDGGPQDLLDAGGGRPRLGLDGARSGDDIGVRFTPK